MSGWEGCFKRPQTYCKGYLERNPKELQVSGVNIEGNRYDVLEELNVASKTFNTVRFMCWRFIDSFLKGEDLFRDIVSEMPSNIKLVPQLFGRDLSGKLEKDRVYEWLDYWFQKDFEQKYLYIDVYNEPRPWENPMERQFVTEMLNRCRDITKLPLSVGFAVGTPLKDRKFVEEVTNLCDLSTFHYYNKNPESYITGIKTLIRYYESLGKPIIVSEFGQVANEREQACWLANILNEIKEADVEGYCVHSLRTPEHWHLDWGIYCYDWTPKQSLELFP